MQVPVVVVEEEEEQRAEEGPRLADFQTSHNVQQPDVRICLF